jgi:DNA-binding transcriptional MerR regulator
MNKASYWSQDVYKMLDLGASTLRRWAAELEKKGYQFEKDENKRRRYYEHDVSVLRSIKEMNEHQGMTIDEAINTVIATHNRSDMLDPNMLIERPKDSAELVLSVQKDVLEIKEALGKAFLDLKQENAELKEEIRQMRRELAASKEEPKKKKFLGIF